MKKRFIYQQAAFCILLAGPITSYAQDHAQAGDVMPMRKPTLRTFEASKNQALSSSSNNQNLQDSQKEWNSILDSLENALNQTKTLLAADKASKQHKAVSHATEDALKKEVDGKTKGKLSSYRATADLGDAKLTTSRNGIKHLTNNVLQRIESAIRIAKEANANTIKAHNQAQAATAAADASAATQEPTKHKKSHVIKKDKNEKAVKTTNVF